MIHPLIQCKNIIPTLNGSQGVKTANTTVSNSATIYWATISKDTGRREFPLNL